MRIVISSPARYGLAEVDAEVLDADAVVIGATIAVALAAVWPSAVLVGTAAFRLV